MKIESRSLRDAFGRVLQQIGEENTRVVVLDADVAHPTRSCFFQERIPRRFVQCGIGEQNMVGVASGLATCGFIPVVVSFAAFLVRRCFDQIYNSICFPRLNVKLVGSYCGYTTWGTGASHQTFDDIAIMNTIPNMTIINIGDCTETVGAVHAMVEHQGPVYLRIGRIDDAPSLFSADVPFEIGAIREIRRGKHGVILSTGIMTSICERAVVMLENDGLSLGLSHLSTLKPLEDKTLRDILERNPFVFTVENHGVVGGLGSIIRDFTMENGLSNRIVTIGIRETFGKCGKPDDLLRYFRISHFDIYEKVKSVLQHHRVGGEP
jgi:transketolase